MRNDFHQSQIQRKTILWHETFRFYRSWIFQQKTFSPFFGRLTAIFLTVVFSGQRWQCLAQCRKWTNNIKMINVLADCEQKFRFIHSHDPFCFSTCVQITHCPFFTMGFYVNVGVDVDVVASHLWLCSLTFEIMNVRCLLFRIVYLF